MPGLGIWWSIDGIGFALALSGAWCLGGIGAGSAAGLGLSVPPVLDCRGAASALGFCQRAAREAAPCMSGLRQPDLCEVLAELALLQERVVVLEDQVAELRSGSASSTAAPVTVNYSISGPAVAAPYPDHPSDLPAGFDLPLRHPPAPRDQLRVNTAALYSDEFRSRVAAEAGRFVRRCRDGNHRGESGRDQVKLQSKLYQVFRDFRGELYNPVRVCHTFAECKRLVKPDGYCGGWPSQWEAKLCAREAGIAWPSDAGGSGR